MSDRFQSPTDMYANYLAEIPCSVEHFDATFTPFGERVRPKLVAAGLVVEADGQLSLVEA